MDDIDDVRHVVHTSSLICSARGPNLLRTTDWPTAPTHSVANSLVQTGARAPGGLALRAASGCGARWAIWLIDW
jgi:hypothetical protein